MERIKKIVAQAKVMIPFFMHLHIVNKRDVRNVRKTLKVEKRPSCKIYFETFLKLLNDRTCVGDQDFWQGLCRFQIGDKICEKVEKNYQKEY